MSAEPDTLALLAAWIPAAMVLLLGLVWVARRWRKRRDWR